jgi:hypothetical protein
MRSLLWRSCGLPDDNKLLHARIVLYGQPEIGAPVR